MRFHHKFVRVKNVASVTTFGTDSAPTSRSDMSKDNVFSGRLVNINGFPTQRLVVAFKGPTNAINVTADAYIYDDLTEGWFKLNDGAVTLKPGVLAYFDPPALQEPLLTKKTLESEGYAGNSGSQEILLVVTPGGADPDGTYTFVMSTDVSNPGV